ncbi:enoyl-CoA hydratase-related protein [Azospirillum rugosum]|uniref:Enoyl-CoA hydratase/carnithine racemase n=1 Tax=Azospirillum rugosum TaxID=416170 RepID=A0ABS4SNW3_9PROT|nr:enoyl-CoA hydratase-related protein [Azospirillum rugosum]MBP2293050.1 enoyl-CoA hydratase/carnithine racemase [Azospirillum rugosum]MDQ0526599.1 enoyl-CoA hydratase/carnithine racemase [Azospirillum rugosum]
MPGTVTLTRDGAVATLTLSNPDKLNAFDKPMWHAMIPLLRQLGADDSVRAVVLRGAGGRAFSPGADISEFETERNSPEQGAAYGVLMDEGLTLLRELPHPTLAAIQGACCGIGLAVALACDLRVCTENSRFGVPVSRLGISMALPELKLVHDIAGGPAALEILLEGRVFGAAEAKDKRLVTRIVPEDAFEGEIAATVERITGGAPLAARLHKQFVRRLSDPAPLTEAEMAECYDCFGTEDFREGYRAFLEKRKPVFRGR